MRTLEELIPIVASYTIKISSYNINDDEPMFKELTTDEMKMFVNHYSNNAISYAFVDIYRDAFQKEILRRTTELRDIKLEELGI